MPSPYRASPAKRHWWSSLHAELDLRVVAATNRNRREAVKEGAFRQDLYFRLNVIPIEHPPMRERPEDILPLARFFIEH
jgi:transcriptional regulator with PAS, ATPase and Fis domain